jgi:Flp pilus assembly protein TadD
MTRLAGQERTAVNIGRCAAWCAVLVCCWATVIGCAAKQGYYSSSSHASSEFDLGVDRPPTPQTLYTLARVLAVQGRESECRYVLQELIREHSGFIAAYCELAELHMRAGRIDDASDWLERGLERAPHDHRLAGNLGMCAMMKGEYEEALQHFARAASLGPEEARHRANAAMVLGMMGRYEESLAMYEQVVPPALAHYNLALLARARNDHSRATQELEVARRLDPTLTQW